jgi:hypothetical protein
MRNIICLLGLLVVSSGSVFAEQATGSLSGVVNYCGKGGMEGMQIYIPGRQYMVIIGADGKFSFDRLPVGDYEIGAMIGGQVVYKHDDTVTVKAGETTKLGQLGFCIESLDVQKALPSPMQALHKDPQNPEACAKNYADCDKDPKNGCEINLMSDQWNCGACGNVCTSWEYCALGSCD